MRTEATSWREYSEAQAKRDAVIAAARAVVEHKDRPASWRELDVAARKAAAIAWYEEGPGLWEALRWGLAALDE